MNTWKTDLDFLIICSSKSSKSNSIRVVPPNPDDSIPTTPPLFATFSSENSENCDPYYFVSFSVHLESDDRRYAQSKRSIKV
uniref:Ovule protein n=1 Tax=Caenorhabditis tropicalis TaxID=1561998 RepID=A0A1I7UCK3_9PELO